MFIAVSFIIAHNWKSPVSFRLVPERAPWGGAVVIRTADGKRLYISFKPVDFVVLL